MERQRHSETESRAYLSKLRVLYEVCDERFDVLSSDELKEFQ